MLLVSFFDQSLFIIVHQNKTEGNKGTQVLEEEIFCLFAGVATTLATITVATIIVATITITVPGTIIVATTPILT